jgi:proteasome lid subunit RPN8/RPN11
MAVRALHISGQSIKFMIDDCILREPEEACGLIVGRFDDSGALATDVMPVRNESMSTVRFSIDAMVMYKALKKSEEKGETIVGVYHSHPTGPEPSHLDASYMNGTTYVWVIVEKCATVRAFVYEDGVKEVIIKKMEEAAVTVTSRGSG